MQEVVGSTLMELLESDDKPLRELVDLLRRAAEAVAYAHDRGVLHRDLKPSNVMVADNGAVLVLDWGMAKVNTPESGLASLSTTRTRRSRVTVMGSVAGTPDWMAPEQAMGMLDLIGPWSDVFALGGMLYEALVGGGTFRAATARRQAANLARGLTPGKATKAPPALMRLVTRCTVLEHEHRPDARVFAKALSKWLDASALRAYRGQAG